MNLKNVILPLAAVALFSACQNDENEETLVEERPTVAIVANIGNAVAGRYVQVDESSDDAQFSINDEIGLFMNGQSVSHWEFDGSSWSAEPLMYWVDRTTFHDFYAFYPYTDDTQYATLGSVSMPSLDEQTGEWANLANHDFMIATASQKYSDNNGNVSLTFSHVSTLLKLVLTNSGDLKGATINKITVGRTGLLTNRTYSFSSNETTETGASMDELVWTSEPGKVMEEGGLTLYFIVNGSASTEKKASLTIEYTHQDSEGNVNKFVADTDEFLFAPVSGHKHTFNINVNSQQKVMISSSITPWGDGEGGDVNLEGSEDTNP